MLLAVGAVHQHLLEHGLRTRLGLIAEAGDAWDVHHFAALIGYGAEAVHPWLALESAQVQVAEDDARVRFRAAAEAGLLKILSKMGISTLSSYCGAQIFEALGLGAEVIDRCFTGTVSTIGGIGFTEIAEDVLARHRAAYPEVAAAEPVLPDHGRVRYRRDGEDHGWSPQLVRAMQAAVAADTPQAYDAFRARVAARLPASPRSEEHTSELQSRLHLVCRLLLEKKKSNVQSIAGFRHTHVRPPAQGRREPEPPRESAALTTECSGKSGAALRVERPTTRRARAIN